MFILGLTKHGLEAELLARVEVMCLAGNGGWENSIFQKR
jgi:hypothetical protein